jgi:aminopeptidase
MQDITWEGLPGCFLDSNLWEGKKMTDNLEAMFDKYADLIVRMGLNLQPGQRLMIVDASRNHGIPIQFAPLVRKIAVKAYEAGAEFVDVIWADDQMKLLRFQNAPRNSFNIFPEWLAQALITAVQRGDALLNIIGLNPDLLSTQDPELIGIWHKTVLTHLEPVLEYTRRNAVNWCLVSGSVTGWARKVFPELPEDESVSRLWNTIFKLVRLDHPDPIASWQRHIANLKERCNYFSHKRYVAFKYRAPDTELTVGLPPGHLWKGGQIQSENGIDFIPNLPTEEIFTLADRSHVDGKVRSTKPLFYSGQIIEDFFLEFAQGKVVNYSARKGEAVLKKLFEIDEGAGRLGEVALVPHSTPVAQSGLMFYNTLLDENAASHLALGAAYKFTMKDGEGMSSDEFASAGGNYSMTHVDFMIGSHEMDIDGVLEGGVVEPVMRGGEWAFEV